MHLFPTESLNLHHIGLQQQEITLLESLCNAKPSLLEPFVFCGNLASGEQTDVLLIDADRPDAREQLQRGRQQGPRHLVLVTSRDRKHKHYPTLKRPLSFASLRDLLSPLAAGQSDQTQQAS